MSGVDNTVTYRPRPQDLGTLVNVAALAERGGVTLSFLFDTDLAFDVFVWDQWDLETLAGQINDELMHRRNKDIL